MKQTYRSVVQNTEINPHPYGQLIAEKGGKNIQWSKDNLFNKQSWENWTDMCEKNETRPIPYTLYMNKLIMD